MVSGDVLIRVSFRRTDSLRAVLARLLSESADLDRVISQSYQSRRRGRRLASPSRSKRATGRERVRGGAGLGGRRCHA